MCKYCEWDNSFTTFGENDINNKKMSLGRLINLELDFVIGKNEDGYFISNSIFINNETDDDMTMNTIIKYCPICGRELK